MRFTDIENTLKNRGVRPTPNRILILKELLKASHPVSLAELHSSLEYSIDKASIFRVLEIFSSKDIVHEIEDGSRSLNTNCATATRVTQYPTNTCTSTACCAKRHFASSR